MWETITIAAATVAAAGLTAWIAGERGVRPLRSTRQLMREHGIKNILNLRALHAYVYMRWTRQYIDIAINKLLPNSTAWGRKKWIDRYHGKVMLHEQARAVITLNKSISRRDLEQIIPYPAARDLVLHGPPDVVAYECVCRHSRSRHCQPTQVCMVIGKPFTDFILEHHPGTSRRLSQAEALELLRQEHERGHVHVAWFKDVMLNRFYAICNCCTCCCGGLEAMVRYRAPTVASSGFIARIEAGQCEECGTCERKCPFLAISTSGNKPAVNRDLCMGCGACEAQCPNQAILLVRDEKKGLPFDVRIMH